MAQVAPKADNTIVVARTITQTTLRNARMELHKLSNGERKCFLILSDEADRKALHKPRRNELPELVEQWDGLSEKEIKERMLVGLQKLYHQIDGKRLPELLEQFNKEKTALQSDLEKLSAENQNLHEQVEVLKIDVETLQAKLKRRKPKAFGEQLPMTEMEAERAKVTGLLVYAGPTDDSAFVIDVLELDGHVRRIKGMSLASAMIDAGVTMCDPVTITEGDVFKVKVVETSNDNRRSKDHLYKTWVIEKEKIDHE